MEDLLEILRYISMDDPRAAQAIKNDIEAKAVTLPSHPFRYRPGRVTGTREMPIRPNNLVIYAALPEAITILRVLHAAQQWP